MSYSVITFVVTQGDAEHGVLHFAHPSAMRILISENRSPACVAVLPSYTYLATCSIMFPPTATVDVMAVSFSITLVLLRFMLRPTGSW